METKNIEIKIEYETTQTFGRKPENIKLSIGKRQTLPLREQLFDHEWDALCELKERHPKICRFYSDEFLCACLFSRKMDIDRVNVLLLANWKWRKQNKLIDIPTIDEINLEVFHTFFGIPGARTEDGCGILYATVNPAHTAGQEPWTVESVTKAATFFNFVGVFLEGMDYVRNGICISMDLYNFGWAHWDYGFWYGMGGMWTDTFPMLMRRIAIINPPMILSGLLKLASLFVKKKIMGRIAILDSSDTENLHGHLEADAMQVSSVFGGKIEYTWKQYESELREFCKENQDRLIWLPPKDKKGKFIKDGSEFSSTSKGYYSESQSISCRSEDDRSSGSNYETPRKKKNTSRIGLNLSSSKKSKSAMIAEKSGKDKSSSEK
jgi:hypothetical protein